MNKKALTLIEILIVVAILSVVLGILGVEVMRYWEDSKKKLAITQLNKVRRIIHQYANDNYGQYPKDFRTLVERGYIPSVPINPLTNTIDWQARSTGADPQLSGSWLKVNNDGSIGTPMTWDADKFLFDIRIPASSPYSLIDEKWKSMPRE
ncbi:MAG: type II secretion system protein [Candidatus Muiribacteriota bacterium]|jgi:general secretion pathway protein G